MSEAALLEYKALASRVAAGERSGSTTCEEDDLLVRMDVLWYQMTVAEQDQIRAEAKTRKP